MKVKKQEVDEKHRDPLFCSCVLTPNIKKIWSTSQQVRPARVPAFFEWKSFSALKFFFLFLGYKMKKIKISLYKLILQLNTGLYNTTVLGWGFFPLLFRAHTIRSKWLLENLLLPFFTTWGIQIIFFSRQLNISLKDHSINFLEYMAKRPKWYCTTFNSFQIRSTTESVLN